MTLEEEYPFIVWDEPVKVTVPGVGEALACRRCIATYGLRGVDVNELPQTIDEFHAHLSAFHGDANA